MFFRAEKNSQRAFRRCFFGLVRNRGCVAKAASCSGHTFSEVVAERTVGYLEQVAGNGEEHSTGGADLREMCVSSDQGVCFFGIGHVECLGSS